MRIAQSLLTSVQIQYHLSTLTSQGAVLLKRRMVIGFTIAFWLIASVLPICDLTLTLVNGKGHLIFRGLQVGTRLRTNIYYGVTDIDTRLNSFIVWLQKHVHGS